jgi:RecT family
MTQSNAMTKRPTAPLPIAAQQLDVEALPELTGFSVPELAEMVRDGGVAAGADNAALVTFCLSAKARGLDPRRRQCYYIKRGGKWTFTTAIDGFSAIAARTGRDGGIDTPRYRGHLSIDVIVDGKKAVVDAPEEAEVTIWKLVGPTYIPRPFNGTAAWAEYAPTDMNAPGSNMWRRYPRRMLSKCAAAQAYRYAFPEELADVELEDDADRSIDVQEMRRGARPAAPQLPPERPTRSYEDVFETEDAQEERVNRETARAHDPEPQRAQAIVDQAHVAAEQRRLDMAEIDRQRREEGLR